MATALGIGARILPATDDRFRTRLETDEGPLDFQDYFVRRRQEPEVHGRHLRRRGDRPADAGAFSRQSPARTSSSSVRPTRSSASVRSWRWPACGRRWTRPGSEGRRQPHRRADARSRARPTGCSRQPGPRIDAPSASRGIYAGLVDRFVLDTADAALAPAIEAARDGGRRPRHRDARRRRPASARPPSLLTSVQEPIAAVATDSDMLHR